MKLGLFSVDWHIVNKGDGTQDAYAQAANYWRLFLPSRELTKNAGYEVVHSFNFEPAEDGHLRVCDPHGTWHDDCDIVVLQRWMHKDGAKITKRARAAGQIIIHDVDDNYWALPKTNISRHYTDPTKYPDFNRDAYWKNIAAASAVTVSTPALANQLSRCGPPVFLARNYIDIDAWQVRDPMSPGLVGWVGGLPWRGHDVAILKLGIAQFLKDHNLRFYHGGHIDNYAAGRQALARFGMTVTAQKESPHIADQLGMDRSMVDTRPLCDMSGVPNLWSPISVAMIPLDDTAFNRSKSWVKGLEACAAGLPFIASNLPEYKELGVGRLVRNDRPDEWVGALLDLLEPDTRIAESARNRARAETLSIQQNWQVWDSIYREFVPSSIAA